MNPSLSELQNWMRRVVVDPRGAEPAIRDLGSLDVLGDSRAPVIDRLSVYAEAYFSRIAESMASDFRALRRVLGEESFLKIVADYLKMYPSRSTNIGEVGRSLPLFLSGYAPDSVYLSELAALEWAVIEAFYEGERPAASFSGEDPSETRFALHPSVRFVDTSWNIEAVWRGDADEFESCSARTQLVYRSAGGTVATEALDPVAFRVLMNFSKGLALGEVCESLPENFEPAQLSAWFARWAGLVLV